MPWRGGEDGEGGGEGFEGDDAAGFGEAGGDAEGAE